MNLRIIFDTPYGSDEYITTIRPDQSEVIVHYTKARNITLGIISMIVAILAVLIIVPMRKRRRFFTNLYLFIERAYRS